jgi:hypothetical protein
MDESRRRLAERLQRAERVLQEAQRSLNGTDGARLLYLAARVHYAEAERDAVCALANGLFVHRDPESS